MWPLITKEGNREILVADLDRQGLREKVGEPTIDDGEEWVYIGKFNHAWGVPLGRLLAIVGSVNEPVWKTVVVTFDTDGIVERIRVSTTSSSIIDARRHIFLMGVPIDLPGRQRAGREQEVP